MGRMFYLHGNKSFSCPFVNNYFVNGLSCTQCEFYIIYDNMCDCLYCSNNESTICGHKSEPTEQDIELIKFCNKLI